MANVLECYDRLLARSVGRMSRDQADRAARGGGRGDVPELELFELFLARVDADLPAAAEAEPATRFGERLRSVYGAVDPEVDLNPDLDGGAETVPTPRPPRPSGSAPLADRLGGRPKLAERYRVVREIGRGGMGEVYEVWDEDLRRPLAMKVARTTHAGGVVDPSQLGRFLEEAQVTGQLDHPGIVPVHELGFDEQDRVYFTMRLVQGRDLARILGDPQPEDEWSRARGLGVLLRLCEALSFAHAKGVVHRDLKPANVMVGRFGEVYVMDWGLAKVRGRPAAGPAGEAVRTERSEEIAADPDSPLLTEHGAVVGTPAYMSPEQARGDAARIDERADLYSVGAILYHVLTGRVPYDEPGRRQSPHAVLARVLAGPPAPVAALAPDVPPELVAVCEKAMAREREDRYPSVEAFARDLRAYTEGRVVSAHRTGALVELRKWVGRNRAVAGVSAGLLVALVVVAVVSTVLFVNERELRRSVVRVDRVTLTGLQLEADRLWPALPARIPDYTSWLRQAEDLASRLEVHRAELVEASTKTRRDELQDFVEDLERFLDPAEGRVDGRSPEHGPGVQRRGSTSRPEWPR